MKILALEFSSDARSVALGQITLPAVQLLATITEPGPRGCTGLVLIDRVLAQAGIGPAEIEVIAVGLGPGSYAGIRSAIALAQGWQLGRNVRLLGIGSVVRPGELLPSAEGLIEAAAGRSDFVPGEKLEPVYLREVSFVKAAPPRFG